MTIALTSPAFLDDEIMPRAFTCDGDNVAPPLHWSGVPNGTRSFALLLEDPDTAGGPFIHWVLYDIPRRTKQWPSGVSAKSIRNSFGRSGYGGPCPPTGDGAHRYVFSIYAVNVPYLELSEGCMNELRVALATHAISSGRLVGRYGR
jgi:Raf kinase inhibitor-like YbhB/YbcL family protein